MEIHEPVQCQRSSVLDLIQEDADASNEVITRSLRTCARSSSSMAQQVGLWHWSRPLISTKSKSSRL